MTRIKHLNFLPNHDCPTKTAAEKDPDTEGKEYNPKASVQLATLNEISTIDLPIHDDWIREIVDQTWPEDASTTPFVKAHMNAVTAKIPMITLRAIAAHAGGRILEDACEQCLQRSNCGDQYRNQLLAIDKKTEEKKTVFGTESSLPSDDCDIKRTLIDIELQLEKGAKMALAAESGVYQYTDLRGQFNDTTVTLLYLERLITKSMARKIE
ncbi:hypothetical protein KEM56_007205 [Ascosphaera pollenicola]|nr:hypothetical protein KEM56_007205 [Ascosphaera pollenicola]